MKKEISLRIIKIAIALLFGILLFPYLKNIATDYFDQLNYFYGLLLGLVVSIISLVLYFTLRTVPFFRKFDANNGLCDCIDYLESIVILTICIIIGLSILSPFWVCITFIAMETFQIVFKKLKK